MMSLCSNNRCTLMTFQEQESWIQPTNIALDLVMMGILGF